MPVSLLLLILLAAFLHAGWNAWVKASGSGFEAMFLLQTLMGVMGLGLLLAFPFPAEAAWGFALASGLLHTGYNIFLARSYKFGDLGLVYPVARGTAPLLTLVAGQVFAHDPMSQAAMAGVVILVLGIWLIALSPDVWRAQRATLGFALTTSLFISVYTVVDGLGGRLSASASGYTGLVFMLDAFFMLIAGVYWRGSEIWSVYVKRWKPGLAGAAMSGSAYWIVIWAMARAPIAAVAALRETSILFALVFSAKLLNEPMGWRRLAGVILVVSGAIALRS